ncbi:hypothetical protein N9Y92_02060 [Chlamydiales bacterium]|nr:hypothetical protein [Chlamydiales bacterium]
MIARVLFSLSLFPVYLMGLDPVGALHYEIKNIQGEVQTTYERLLTQELMIESLRNEVENSSTNNKGLTQSLVMKFDEIESATKAMKTDLISFKEGYNETQKRTD